MKKTLLCASFASLLWVAIVPSAASALQIQTMPQIDYVPSDMSCPFNVIISAQLRFSKYTGSPTVSVTYHWHWSTGRNGPVHTDQFTLKDLAKYSGPEFAGMVASDDHSLNHDTQTGVHNHQHSQVELVVTAPQRVVSDPVEINANCRVY